jgi:hypothetical protein
MAMNEDFDWLDDTIFAVLLFVTCSRTAALSAVSAFTLILVVGFALLQ